MICDELYAALDSLGITYEKNIPLSPHSTFKIGGICEVGIFPSDISRLTKCISLLKKYAVKYRVLGNCSNVLFCDGILEGAVLFTERICDIQIKGTTVVAQAGASLSVIAAKAAEAGLSGLEFAKGIPGSLGGAVFMNAGAYGGQMSDVILRTTAYDADTEKTVVMTEHGFSYRRSIYARSPSLICLSAEMVLTPADEAEIRSKMRNFAQRRREKQPLEFPSAGSYFKRPEGYFAGKLIEDCGLKGLRVGGACVSEKHAGFIINVGGATSEDVLALEEKIKDAVMKKFGVTLEREVRKVE